MNRISNIWIYIVLLSLIPVSAGATKFISIKGEGYLADTVYNDDLFITGDKIKMESRVDGDLFAFCQEIVHLDTVLGSFNSFSLNAQVLGPVKQSYRGWGYSINCNAPVGRNILIFGKEITIGPQAKIAQDGDMFCSKLIFQGRLDGNLKIMADNAEINGHVGGDIEFEKGHLKIGPDAVIDGGIYYRSPQKAEISNSANIYGEINWEEIETGDRNAGTGITFGKILAWIFSVRGYLLLLSVVSLILLVFSVIPFPALLIIVLYSVIFLISGNVVILLTKDRMRKTLTTIENKFLPSLGLGFIIFFVAPVVSLVILLTLVGAPLGMALLFIFGAALFAGTVYASTFLGWKVWDILGGKAENRSGYLCYSTGIVLLIILSFIPVLGYLLATVAIMTGLGGLAQTFKSKNL
ncbi:MAG: polymer-forming cytoskeletal protein [Candidatus Zixiibacteriota bacterium]|nr:MAG: polymer-forming cytoskeletal protein [candidate division Zixibacteria bacterium]